MRTRSESPLARLPLTATRRSPGFSPAARAAESVFTLRTEVVVSKVGMPIQKIAAKMTIARTMFTAGPARMVATFFQAGMAV